MRYETIRLREAFPRLPAAQQEKNVGFEKYNLDPTLTAYLPDNSAEIDENRRRASIVICPGGGYGETVFHEGEPVALRFLAMGYNVFILKYTVTALRFPAALVQLAAAVACVRQNAERFRADESQIAVCGFSAGGHLAGSLGVFWHESFVTEFLGLEPERVRPDAMILCYPVITSGSFAHGPSFEHLLGPDAPEPLRERVSLEKQVTPKTPPTFLWHTVEDKTVPVENSLLFADALRKNQILFELHIYPHGRHGMALCTPETGRDDYLNPHCASWVSLCDEWLQETL